MVVAMCGFLLFPIRNRMLVLFIYILDNASRLSFFLFFVTIKFTQERGIKSQPVSH